MAPQNTFISVSQSFMTAILAFLMQ